MAERLGLKVGTSGIGVVANGSGSKQHANGDSSTGVNTTVSATDKVTITAPGKTSLNGAIVSGNQIGVDTGNLDIISPQDSATYDSHSSQTGFGGKVSVPGAGTGWGVNGNYSNQKITNDYQSTGHLSGLYAGNGGVQVDVDDTTHLKGGVISSTGGDSHLNTGKLIAESQENHSKWDATSTGGGLSLGTDALGGTLGPLGVIAGNMAANSGLIAGGNRKHDETSTSQSAISGNVTVNAGNTEGGYTTDVSSADGHLENKFDADKLANQLQNSQLGMQLVGEVMGQISDALNSNGVKGFGEGGIGRLALEAAANAAVAGATGGDAGSAAASTAASGLVSAQTRLLAMEVGKQLSDDPNTQLLIANALSNMVAGGTGGLTDLVMGGNGMNGTSLGAIMQAYNQANDPNGGKVDESTKKILDALFNTVEAASYFPVIGDPASLVLALMYATKGDYTNASLNLTAAALGIFLLGEGKLVVKGGVLVAEETDKLLANNKNDTYYTVAKETETSEGTNVDVTVKHEGNIDQSVTEKTPISSSEAPNINMDHILDGEVKTYKDGTQAGTGGHYLKNPNVRVTEWTGAADKNGVTKGKIAIRDPATGQWVAKKGETTFFPSYWSKRETASQIQSAFANAKPGSRPNQWQGTSSSGIKIEGYYNKDGSVATAYPVYEGIKKQ